MPIPLSELRLEDAARFPSTGVIVESPLSTPTNVTVTGKDGFFLVQWSPVGAGSGYEIAVMTDRDLDTPDEGVHRVPGLRSINWRYQAGNTALTRRFAVRTYSDAGFVSEWSAIVSATSLAVSQSVSGKHEPADTTFNATETTLASVSLTATGRTVVLIGRLGIRSITTAGKTVTLRVKEGSTALGTVGDRAFASGSEFSIVPVLGIGTSTAGARTYTLTGQNNTDNVSIDATRIQFIVFETPFSSAVEAGAAPPAPPSPPPPSEPPPPTGEPESNAPIGKAGL